MKPDSLGVSISTIFRYKNGNIEKAPVNLLSDIAKFLRTSEALPMGWEDVSESSISNIYPIELKRFPLLGEIARGRPKYVH